MPSKPQQNELSKQQKENLIAEFILQLELLDKLCQTRTTDEVALHIEFLIAFYSRG